ncbi:MAG TPA: hypothetical protein VGB83_02050 [Actinomycetota bacterium]
MRRTVLQAVVGIASALVLVAVGVTSSGAAAGDGFNCNGCIDRKDIANKAIGSGEVVDNSIKPGDLAANARARVGSVVIVGTTTSTTPETIDTVEVKVPGKGTLLLLLEGTAFIDADAVDASARFARGSLGICDSADSSAACGTTYQTWDYEDPDSTTGINALLPISRARVVSVGSKGTKTYYVNADTDDATEGFNITGGNGGTARLTAFFFPASMSVTSA